MCLNMCLKYVSERSETTATMRVWKEKDEKRSE
jgi:hypothetical protein